MGTFGRTFCSGVAVFEIPESFALGELGRVQRPGDDVVAMAETFVAEIQRRLKMGTRSFLLDLSRLKRIDGAGAGIIVGCHKIIADSGARVVVVSPQRGALRGLSRIKFDSILPMHQNRDIAIAALFREDRDFGVAIQDVVALDLS